MLCGPPLQRQLQSAVQNMTVFNKIADELARKGYQHDAKQLKKNYKKASSKKV